MKTRQEMIYDFMVALAGSNESVFDFLPADLALNNYEAHEAIYVVACKLADQYLECLG
jgi:thymidylate synthase